MQDDYRSEPEYERPTWVTVLAIAGLALGGLGVMASTGQIIMPKMLEFQRGMMRAVEKSIEKAEEERKKRAKEAGTTASPNRHGMQPGPPPKEIFDMFDKFLDMPEWYRTAIMIFGVLGLMVCGFYILASIKLFSATPESVSLFCKAMTVGTIIASANVVTSLCSNSFMGFIMMVNVLFGVIASLILLIVAVTADKSRLRPSTRSGDSGFSG